MKVTIKGVPVYIAPKRYRRREEMMPVGKVIVVKTPDESIEYHVIGHTVNKLTPVTTDKEEGILQKINQFFVPSKIKANQTVNDYDIK